MGLKGPVTPGQVPLAFQALSAEGGERAAQSPDRLGQCAAALVGTGTPTTGAASSPFRPWA